MSTLMFWNKQNGNSNQNGNENGNSGGGKNGKKTWLHSPESLVTGHVAYLVKFLGCTPVDQAKGIETVKDAIRRLQFSQQMKKAESGSNVKTKKVEITISVDGVAIQEPRGGKILHQFPLHNISYCADEKGVKKFFSFIAKNNQNNVPSDSSERHEETHECFVFISSKLASDITLTIGQAFELAYRRFVNETGKGPEASKLQVQNNLLEQKVQAYRQRLKDLIDVVSKSDLDRILMRYGLRDIFEMPQQENGNGNHMSNYNGSNTPDLGIDVSSPSNDDQLLIETSDKHFAPIVPPRNLQSQISSTLDALKPSVGTKLEGLLLNSDSDSDFDPRADENDLFSAEKSSSDTFFGFEPPKTSIGQQLFTMNANNTSTTNGNALNGLSNQTPPLLAPPPKASVPRRNGTAANQDLFGSTPFDQPLSPSPFDVQCDTMTAPPIQNGSSKSIPNPFNDSIAPFNVPNRSNGVAFKHNQTAVSQSHAFSEIHNFSMNLEKLDGVLRNFGNPSNPFAPSQSGMVASGVANGNHAMDMNELDLTAKRMDFTMNGTNFTSLHDHSESDTSTLFGSLHSDSNGSCGEGKKADSAKKEIPIDLLKDVAKAAFNEFSNGKYKNNEFINKIASVDRVGA